MKIAKIVVNSVLALSLVTGAVVAKDFYNEYKIVQDSKKLLEDSSEQLLSIMEKIAGKNNSIVSTNKITTIAASDIASINNALCKDGITVDYIKVFKTDSEGKLNLVTTVNDKNDISNLESGYVLEYSIYSNNPKDYLSYVATIPVNLASMSVYPLDNRITYRVIFEGDLVNG